MLRQWCIRGDANFATHPIPWKRHWRLKIRLASRVNPAILNKHNFRAYRTGDRGREHCHHMPNQQAFHPQWAVTILVHVPGENQQTPIPSRAWV